jgi:hypothetical protein
VRLTEAALALLLLLTLCSFRDLPLVDLPQHALALANWLRIDQQRSDVAPLELNFRTPYLLAYPVARALSAVLPVLLALKLVFWASVVLQARTLRLLCERLGHDAWLGLLGYPLGLGYSFCFGFVAFCAALPLVYLGFARVVAHRESPTLQSGLRLSLLLSSLFVAHGVALSFFLAVTAPLLLLGAGKLWRRVWPLLPLPLLGAVWLAPGRTGTRLGGDLWELEPERWLQLPAQLVGIGSPDHLATVFGVALLAVLGASLGRLRALPFWLPLLATLLGYGLFPTLFRGAGPLHPRFGSYLVPALLLAFAPRSGAELSGAGLSARRAASVFVSAGVILSFLARLPEFNRETAGLHTLISRLPTDLALRPIVFERGGRAFPGTPAHLHLPAYYSLEKGGSSGYSFAMYSISVVRFRPGVKMLMGGGSEWAPERFSAEREACDYDYFVVKSSDDRTAWLFPGPRPAALLEQHEGDWWGYRRTDAARCE